MVSFLINFISNMVKGILCNCVVTTTQSMLSMHYIIWLYCDTWTAVYRSVCNYQMCHSDRFMWFEILFCYTETKKNESPTLTLHNKQEISIRYILFIITLYALQTRKIDSPILLLDTSTYFLLWAESLMCLFMSIFRRCQRGKQVEDGLRLCVTLTPGWLIY